MQAVVLAGGLGTRMLPHTEHVPKILLEVGGRPFAFWLLERLRDAGFDDVVLCVAHLGDSVRDAVGDGSGFGVAVRYSDEGDELLGTAGALRNALELLEPTFLVTYGDSYLPFDYAAPLRALERHTSARGTMAVFENHDVIEPSNVAVRDGWVVRYDKHRSMSPIELDHIDYGATALRRDVVQAIPERVTVGLDTLQSELAREGTMLGCRVETRFYEIGSLSGRADLEAYLLGARRKQT